VDAPVGIPRRAVPSTVYVESRVPSGHPSAALLGDERVGAGVAVAPDRVLTAHYVVMGASQIAVTGFDGRPRQVRSTRLSHETGLAQLELDGPELLPVRLAARGAAAPGLPVFLLTCGSPRERKGASGVVISVGPFEAFWEYQLDHAILTTAMNPGLAGAPLLDREARLLGIVSLGLTAVGRYSLAIPLDLYLDETWAEVQQRRAWLGLFPHVLEGSVTLTGVVPNGPAERAGLGRGDVIVSVDGVAVTSLRELYTQIWRKRPGEVVRMQVLRDGAIRPLEVVAADRYEFFA
jgi:S1-C subfamily serine protease